MQPGDVVSGRFELVELAGVGGMGSVYRALDRVEGGDAAVKFLRTPGVAALRRFTLEARVLAELLHPGIVRYLAHGDSDGEAFLAMEWLEGEDLARRLSRKPLTVPEAIGLVVRAAETLTVAHRRGVVHRDLKPSNLFLVGGELERLKVLDFGVARLSREEAPATLAGEVVGTPGYMAPEQARGSELVDERADVFALGCVLFRCLAGRAPFVGRDALAVLAKLALEPAPRLRDVRPDAPADLERVVDQMLATDPAHRYADAAAVVRALGGIELEAPAAEPARPTALTASEQRVIAVVLAARALPMHGRDGLTLAPEDLGPTGDTALAPDKYVGEARLAQLAQRFGASLAVLRDGSVALTLSESGQNPGSATDLAARAAGCALAIRGALPDVPLVVTAGRGEFTRHGVVGDAIDKASTLAMREPVRTSSDGPYLVAIDDMIAGLLPAGFDLAGEPSRRLLVGAGSADAGQRTLLGKATPCVGRARELRELEALYDECVAEGASRAAVVTAPAGVGKSRLRYEVLRRLASRPEPPAVWIARGDPMSSGAALGMAADVVRRAAGIDDGDADDTRRTKVAALAAEGHGADDARRVAEFLGELVGAPIPDEEGSFELRAARRDRALLADQMQRAFEDWLSAACTRGPVVLVLEDLHWGDPPTVRFVDGALKNLEERPLFVLALGRPEVDDLFPSLWSRRHLTRMPLPELGRRAAAELAREALGPAVAAETVARIVERAGGNALYLEELIRAADEGAGDAMPDTVVAMLEVRLERLESDARRILRAASVFGQTFREGGALALVGGEPAQLHEWLRELASRELIARRQGGDGADPEFAFRHALVREAAYAMLTEADRALGHRLAGAWLETRGASDPMVLAEHLERGGEHERAAVWWHKASVSAIAGNDFAAAIERAQRGLQSAKGALRGELRLVQAEAHRWRAEPTSAELCGADALAWLPEGSSTWFTAAIEHATACAHQGNLEGAMSALDRVREVAERGATDDVTLLAFARSAMLLSQIGGESTAAALIARIEAARPDGASWDPAVLARVLAAKAHRALAAGDAGSYIEAMDGVSAAFARAGEVRASRQATVNAAYGRMGVGKYAAARDTLEDALAAAERMGLEYVAASARHNLGLALAHLGRFPEATAAEQAAVEFFGAQGSSPILAASHAYLAEIHRLAGQLELAESEAERAVRVARDQSPHSLPLCLGVEARVLVARGRADRAVAAAEEAAAALHETLRGDEAESIVHLAVAEARLAAEDRAGARAALRHACARLEARAAYMTDVDVRASFLENVPEHARTFALLRELGEDDA